MSPDYPVARATGYALRHLAALTPAEQMRVMLCAMKQRGWPFEDAWPNAIQRLRAQPYMTEVERQELAQWKRTLAWGKPAWEAAYYDGPPVSLNGVDKGADLSAADSSVMDHTGELPKVA